MAQVPALRLLIEIGASFTEQITWTSDGVLVPLPIGTIAEAKIRSFLFDESVIQRFHTTPGPTDGLIVLTNPGVTTLSLTPAQTALLLPVVDAVFDIKYTFAGGTVLVKFVDGTGRCDIRGVVTRP